MSTALTGTSALQRRYAGRATAGFLRRPAVHAMAGTRVALCSGPVLALLLVWTARDGGYSTLSWLPGAIGLVLLLAWARLVFGRGRAWGRYGRLALIALGLYAAWSYGSVWWAVDKGAAVTGSNRTLLYLLVFALFAGLEWTPRRLELALIAYLLGLGALALMVLARIALGPTSQLLQAGTLAAGLGYHNATAAVGTIGAAGSIVLGCSRRRRATARAALAVAATVCLVISLLAESRGWMLTLPVIVATLLAIAPRPGRVAAWGLIPCGAALLTLPWVLHGWSLADAGGTAASVSAADTVTARIGLLAALAAGVVGWLLARLEQRFALSARGARAARRLSRLSIALTAEIAVGGAALLIGGGALARGWHQFTTDAPMQLGVSRFAELGGGRYDFWRVALQNFITHPLGGLGQDNFAQAYVAARHTGEEPLWVHSLELRLLAHTGAVGLALFVAFLAFAILAARRAARRETSSARLALAAALVPLAVWLVHGSVDWFWELPALSGAVFAFLGAAVALEPRPDLSGTRGGTAVRRAGAAITFCSMAAALALLVSAYLGDRELQQGRALAATNPAQALIKLHLAARLAPLSSAPQALEASVDLRAGNAVGALRSSSLGLRRDPGDWVLWLEDALAAGAAGRPSLERAALDRASVLDPREPVVALARRRAGAGRQLTITEAASILGARARARVAP